ncbi:GT2 family glycosyltransferase [Actinoplanes octamycinicus]|uniref:GT2 family glycosyltransferase n=1 Tax=Actinoplanes octamycinicus TaxID=135948 RepID=A0A7W7MBQ4_9ACTN|nr:glycosyltransferase family 2 protein [Actinoplanes octamycinicus]MBB4744348.1 GT2 family glycosyltransferase [Actinoplanes octamycinicus]GIE56691.1 glycosyl transferase family 2 [Actinoplanes octamycinicus]
MTTDHHVYTPVARTYGTPLREPVSVLICAYTMRRWDDVLAAVDSVRPQLGGRDEVILVVDHNAELRAGLEARFAGTPWLRILSNTGKQGLSGARNTGVAAARHDIVIFLDDDATAEPGMVAAMVLAMEEERVVAVGGTPLPAWPAAVRPWWFPPEFDWVVGCAYVGLPTRRAEVRNVIGAVMAFRRGVLDRVGPFSTEVGRVGTLPLGCEETELCIRVRQQLPGAVIYHLPDARVRHRVTPDRTTWRYFLSRCYSEGVSKAMVSRLVGSGDALSTERRYVTRILPRAVGRSLLGVARGRLAAAGPGVAVLCGLAATGAGYLRGSLTR